MRCHEVEYLLSGYLDGRVSPSERRAVSQHLEECPACPAHVEQLASARQAVRLLEPHSVPADLQTTLRVLASRVAARRRARLTWRLRLADWIDTARVRLDNLMRPLAIPAAGGIVAAMVLFSLIAPTMKRPPTPAVDVPTAFYTQALLEDPEALAPGADNLIVDISVDDQGRVVDYSLPYAPALARNLIWRRAIEHRLVFARFIPATVFGQPMSGKVRITLFNVKG